MTSTMTALSLVKSSHHAGSHCGTLISTPATVSVDGVDAAAASADGPSRRRHVDSDDDGGGFDGARPGTGIISGTCGGVDSSVQPFDSRFAAPTCTSK